MLLILASLRWRGGEKNGSGGQYKAHGRRSLSKFVAPGQCAGCYEIKGANVLVYLLENPHLVPEEWKGKRVFFLAPFTAPAVAICACVACAGVTAGGAGFMTGLIANEAAAIRPRSLAKL
jgi:hypothetical protein